MHSMSTSICASDTLRTPALRAKLLMYPLRMAYIEENLKTRRQMATEDEDKPSTSQGPKEELLKFEDKYRTQNTKVQEGSVTSSLAMLTAIPEVDLGMECVFSSYATFVLLLTLAFSVHDSRTLKKRKRRNEQRLRNESDNRLPSQARTRRISLPLDVSANPRSPAI